MANIIKPKRSESSGQTPTLSPGELAVNIADHKIWVADSSGTPVLIVDGNAAPTETDPVFTASASYSITTSDITNWNTAYGWGDHSAAGYLNTETDPIFAASAAFSITTTDTGNWNTAYGWGDHSSVGYLTTETDPIFTASDAASITATDIGNWNTAYGWGDHSTIGYLTTETDPVFSASDAASITATDISNWNAKPDTVAVTSTGATLTVTDNTVGGAVSFNLETPQGIATTDSPSFAGLTVASLIYPSADGTSGQVIVTDGAGNLSFATAGGGASALDDLTDVTIATPAANDVLVYNSTSSQWENTQLTTNPGGSTGQVQWNNSGSMDGIAETTYSTSSPIALQISQTTNTRTSLVLTINASPSADIFYWADSSLNIKGGINSYGNLYFMSGQGAAFRDSSGNEIVLTAPSSGSNWTMRLPAADGASGQVLKTNGSGQLSFTDTVANLSGGLGGSIPYQSAANTTSMLANGTSGQVLKSNGGTSAPSWGNVLPSGVIQMFGGSVIPSGWLSCDGSAVSRSTYSALFSAIGTTFGSGNGSTTFNIPDMRGRMGMGSGTGYGLNSSGTGAPSGTAQTARTLGQWGGEETNLLTANEMPSHNHGGQTQAAGSHYHTFGKPALSYVSPSGTVTVSMPGGTMHKFSDGDGVNDTDTAANHQHGIDAQGGGSRHATIPPFVVLNFIIKT